MKTLTIWAARNRRKALFIMIILHLLLIINGIAAGKMLIEKEIILNIWFRNFAVLLFLIAFFFYPVKAGKYSLFKYDSDSKIFRYSFFKHKMLDTLSSVSAFMMILYVANISFSENNLSVWFVQDLKAADFQTQKSKTAVAENYKISDVKSLNSETKILDKQSSKHKLIKKLRKNKPQTDWGFIGKLILIIVLSLAATFVLAILSCAILCNGFEVLGILLFSGGLLGLISLSIFFIKKLIRKRELKFNVKKYEE